MEVSDEKRLKMEIVKISQRCGLQGWCPGTLGNISALSPILECIFIKRSGADLSRLRLADVLTLDLDGNVLKGDGKPSAETPFHVRIYRIRKDVRAVFHVHPPYATAHAVAGKKIPMVTEAAKIVLVDVPLLSRAPSGSADLASRVAEGFKDLRVKAVLLSEHGVIAVGETLESAYHTAALVEDTAKIAFLSSLIKAKFLD